MGMGRTVPIPESGKEVIGIGIGVDIYLGLLPCF